MIKPYALKKLVLISFTALFLAAAAGDLREAPTELRLPPQAQKAGHLTAGDILELVVKVPEGIDTTSGPVEPSMAAQLESGPVELNDGRVLFWRRLDEKATELVVGITSYKPGKLAIPAIVFMSAGKALFSSVPQTAEFISVGGDKFQDDIYPPVTVAMPIWFWILVGLLSLGLVLGGIYALARWSQKKRAMKDELLRAPRILSPIEEFEKVRQETDAKGYVSKAIFKPHYFALSDAAKRFLGKAFRFDAEERTTRELVRELESLGLSNDLRDQWKQVFEEMDIVKFTDQAPQIEPALSLSERIAGLVRMSYKDSPVAREARIVTEAPK